MWAMEIALYEAPKSRRLLSGVCVGYGDGPVVGAGDGPGVCAQGGEDVVSRVSDEEGPC